MMTAEEFMLENLESMDQCDVERVMIEFAKMHVEAALKVAVEEAYIDDYDKYGNYCPNINIKSVLTSYPLTNIK